MCAGAYPRAGIGRVLAVPRSRLYAREQRRLGDDAEEQRGRAHLERIAGPWPTSGSRRVPAHLRRARGAGDVAVKGQRVRRLRHDLGLAGHAPTRRCRPTKRDHPAPRYPNLVAGLVVAPPDAVWGADITYGHVQCDFVSLAVRRDVSTRALRGWELSRHLDQARPRTARERAVAAGQVPALHHSDQGVQDAATAYVIRLERLGTQISTAEQGEPRQHGYAERLMRTIKAEEVALAE